MVIMPPDHPLADRKRLKMDELADNAFIGFEQGFLLNDRIKAVCRQRGLKLNECLRSGQLDFIMTLVATGIGVALLPRLELERRELPNIHIALLDEEELRWRAAFVWRRGAVLSSAAQPCQAPPRRRGSAGKRKARMTASGAEADPDGTRKVRHRRLSKRRHLFQLKNRPFVPAQPGASKPVSSGRQHG